MTAVTRTAAASMPASSAASDFVLRVSRGLVVVACFLVPNYALKGVGGFPLSDTAFLLAAVVSMFSLARPRRPLPRLLVAAAILAGASTLIIAIKTPGVGGGTVSNYLRLLFIWLVLPAVTCSTLITRRHVQHAVMALYLGCATTALAAVTSFLGFSLLPKSLLSAQGADSNSAPDLANQAAGISQRLVGLNTHPNGQGGALAVGIAIGAALVIYGLRQWWILLALVVCIAGLMLSGSITGTIAILVGMLVVLLRSRKRLKVVVGSFLAGVPLYLLITSFQSSQLVVLTPFQRLQAASGNGIGISTLHLRELTISFAWPYIYHDPIVGVGFGPGIGGTYDGVTLVHNILILAWYQGGIFLLVGVICAGLAGLRAGWRRRPESPIAEALFVAAIVALFFANTGPALLDRYVWLPVVLMVAWRAADSAARE